jgi:CBS domain-containing protein
MNIGEVCNREVIVVSRDTTIVEAAQIMRENHVGDLVITEDRNNMRVPVGILTDRDIVIEIIAREVEMDSVSVGDIMSDDLLTAVEDEDTDEVMWKMRNKGVRRIPIVNKEGGLIGIVSVDDLLDLFAEKMEDLVRLITREQMRERRIREVS